MRILVLLSAALCARAKVSCDHSSTAVQADGTVELPCKVTGAFGIRLGSFTVHAHPCKPDFRVTGSYGVDEVMSPDRNSFDAGPCEITFSYVHATETGLSMCAEADCTLYSTSGCSEASVPDVCGGMLSCGECTREAACGWCYDTGTCLPASGGEGTSVGGQKVHTDRCDVCADFEYAACSQCSENCDGHGTCTDRLCTCAPGWAGTGNRCDTFNVRGLPDPADACRNLRVEARPLSFAPGRPHSAAVTVAFEPASWRRQLAFFAIVKHPNTTADPPRVYVRYDGQVDLTNGVYDLHTGAAAAAGFPTESCAEPPAAVLPVHTGELVPVLVATNPPLSEELTLWFGHNGSSAAAGDAYTVILGFCAEGFTGFPCTTQVSHVDVYSAAAPAAPPVSPYELASTVHFDVPVGGARYVQFPVGNGVTAAKVTTGVSPGWGPAPVWEHRLVFKGRVVARGTDAIVEATPFASVNWGVVVALPEFAGEAYGNVTLTLALTVCEWAKDSPCAHVHPVSQPQHTVTWPRGDEWLHFVFPVGFGVNRMTVTAVVTPPLDAQIIAAYEKFPTESLGLTPGDEYAKRTGSELTVENPRAGDWHLACYFRKSRSGDVQVALSVETSACPTCGPPECAAGAGTLTVVECLKRCAATGPLHSLSLCAPGETQAPTPTAAPQTVAPATTPPTTPSPAMASPAATGAPEPFPDTRAPASVSPSAAPAAGSGRGTPDPAGGAAPPDGTSTFVLRSLLAMSLFSAFAVAGYVAYARVHKKHAQRRRQAGGYDPPPIPGAEVIDSDEDEAFEMSGEPDMDDPFSNSMTALATTQ
eukprot:gene22660-34684_t